MASPHRRSAATPASDPPATPSGASSPQTSYLLLAAVVLFWGANWPIMKIGLQSITPMWFAVARIGMGAATLFAVLAASGRLRRPRRGDWPVVLSVAVLQMVVYLSCVNFALLQVEAGRAVILAYTTPLWVTPAAVLLLGERVTPRKAAGLALGLAGIATLFNPLGFDWSDRDVLLGNGLLMLAALAWAGAILHVRAHTWVSSPLQLAPWQMLLALPVLTAVAVAVEGDAEIAWSPELIAILAYNGPIATAFCFWAVVTVQRSLPSISTSLGLLGVPVAGLAFATAVLGEPLTATKLGGLVLILGGMSLVNLAELARSGGRLG